MAHSPTANTSLANETLHKINHARDASPRQIASMAADLLASRARIADLEAENRAIRGAVDGAVDATTKMWTDHAAVRTGKAGQHTVRLISLRRVGAPSWRRGQRRRPA